MYTIINWVDYTDSIPPDSEDNGSGSSGGIQSNASLSDPNSTWDFILDDPNQQITLRSGMPVVVFDDNPPPVGNLATIPTMNFAQNPSFNGVAPALASWADAGTLSGLWSYATPQNPKITVNNNALGFEELQQSSLNNIQGNIIAGQQYCFSVYQRGSGTISNIQTFINLTFTDVNDNNIGPTFSKVLTPVVGLVRAVIVGTAPAGTAGAFLEIGVQTTVAGNNSGSVAFSTAQFEPMWFAKRGVSYPTPDCNFSQVNSVLMPDGTTSRACRRFAGYIEDRIVSYAGKQRHYEVKCASSSKLLETVGLFSASYAGTQDTTIISTTVGSIPTSANFTSPIGRLSTGQQNAFAPASTLIPGVIIDSMSWNNATLRRMLNDIGAQSGSLYYVDAYYYLWYVPPSFAGRAINLSDTPDNITTFPYSNFSIEYDFTNPVNTALVVGSKQNAAAITDPFTGNGSQTVFNLTEPPFTITTVTVGGATQRCGVDGVDNKKFGSALTFKALVNKQKQTITFATAPANAAAIVITYTYEDQVISQVIAADSVGNNNVSFWGLVNDSAITSTTAAKNRGLAELAAYAYDRVIITFDLLGIYIPVGSLVLFTNQSEGLVGAPFVVQTVDSDLLGGGVDNWQYTAGVYNPTIIDHLRNATKAIQKSPTTANVVVIASIDVALFDSLHINDTLVVNVSNYASAVGVDLPLCQFRMGESAGTTLNDISGNGNNGTLHGGITLGTTGLINHDTNKAMTFNGSTGYISLPTGFIPTGAGHAFSIECWCKIPTLPGLGHYCMVAMGARVANQMGALYLVDGNAFTLDIFGTIVASGVTPLANTIYHVVGTHDGTTLRIYINGQLDTHAGTASLVASFASIGADGTSPVEFFPGILDEVAIYGTVLSSARVLAHYNAGI